MRQNKIMDTMQSNSDYHINVDVFEGPLDLLLHLIKKNDLDVYDIPIAFMLEEYMRYLDSIRELDIDLAGEFLLMASELVHIKSRLLLPDDSPPEEDEGLDPRADLVRRLLEYQQFKKAGEDFTKRTLLGRDVFVPLFPERVRQDDLGPVDGSIYDLVDAFSRILKHIPEDRYHEVATDRISINDRIYQIAALVKKDATITIDELLLGRVTKYDVVITFLAVLEMCKLRMIKIYQSETFGKIYLQGMMEDVKSEDVLKLVESDIGSEK